MQIMLSMLTILSLLHMSLVCFAVFLIANSCIYKLFSSFSHLPSTQNIFCLIFIFQKYSFPSCKQRLQIQHDWLIELKSIAASIIGVVLFFFLWDMIDWIFPNSLMQLPVHWGRVSSDDNKHICFLKLKARFQREHRFMNFNCPTR